jgi:hypothetical protein
VAFVWEQYIHRATVTIELASDTGVALRDIIVPDAEREMRRRASERGWEVLDTWWGEPELHPAYDRATGHAAQDRKVALLYGSALVDKTPAAERTKP